MGLDPNSSVHYMMALEVYPSVLCAFFGCDPNQENPPRAESGKLASCFSDIAR
jgi:hypothetical protein